MKSGVVRNLDSLGRVVIPKEIRRTFGIDEGDPLEVYVNGNEIVLKQYRPGCLLCGTIANEYILEGDKKFCPSCVGKLWLKANEE